MALTLRPEGEPAPAAPVSAAETPSEKIVKAAVASATVKDATGRAIAIKKPTPFDRMMLAKAVGGENAKNEAYMEFAGLAALVTEIDGDRVPAPKSEREIEALVQLLGSDGLVAIGQGIMDNFMDKVEGAQDAAKN